MNDKQRYKALITAAATIYDNLKSGRPMLEDLTIEELTTMQSQVAAQIIRSMEADEQEGTDLASAGTKLLAQLSTKTCQAELAEAIAYTDGLEELNTTELFHLNLAISQQLMTFL